MVVITVCGKEINWKKILFFFGNKLKENTTCKQSALRFFPFSTIFAKIEGDDELVIEFPLGDVNDDDDNGWNDVVGVLF